VTCCLRDIPLRPKYSAVTLTWCLGVPCSLPSRITTRVLKNCKTFFSKTETKTKCSRPRPRPRLHDPRPRLSFLSSRRLETKTLVSRTTSLSPSHDVATCFLHEASLVASWCRWGQLAWELQRKSVTVACRVTCNVYKCVTTFRNARSSQRCNK